jgi:hypothetical protein
MPMKIKVKLKYFPHSYFGNLYPVVISAIEDHIEKVVRCKLLYSDRDRGYAKEFNVNPEDFEKLPEVELEGEVPDEQK